MPSQRAASGPSKRRPRQERAKATVDAMLGGATYILEKEGYDRLTTNRIAEVAGVNISSLYQYFPNKQAVLTEVCDRHLADIQESLSQYTPGSNEPLREILPRIVRSHLDLHTKNRHAHKELLQHLPELERTAVIAELRRQLVAQFRAFLAAYAEQLRVRDLDLAALLMVHFIDAATQAALLEHPALLEKKALEEGLSDVLVRYLIRD